MKIENIRKLLKRLNNCYLFDEIKKSSTFNKNFKFANNYFKYLKLRNSTKLSYYRIAKKLNLPHSLVLNWDIGQTPSLIKIANQIPKENPPINTKWLNLYMEGQWSYKKFIKVPVKIKDYEDITYFLNQLTEVKNDKKEYENIEALNKYQAFGYILSLMISDADKDKLTKVSTRIRIGLSKVYDWNKNIGEALCYCLNKIGIEAKRVKDGKASKRAPNGKYIWRSQLTPLITWMKKACLGLKSNETTTYTGVRMNWILHCPEDILIWILNGIYGGDGCAYVRGWQITNAARPNQKLFIKILKLFGIRSCIRGPKVIIEDKNSLKVASKLPIFRFAIGKVEKTNKLIKMMENSGNIHNRRNYKEIMRKILTLNKEGFSPKDIPLLIFDQYGIGIHPRRVYTRLERGELFEE